MFSTLSIKARLTALFVLVFGGSLLAYSVYIYQTVDDIFESGFDLQLYEFAKEVGDSINYSILWGFQFDTRSFTDSRKVFPFTMREAVIQIRSSSGAPLVSSKSLRGQELPFNRSVYQKVLDGKYVYQDWEAPKQTAHNKYFRTLTFLVKGDADQFVILQVAVPDRYVRQNSQKILRIFLYSIPFLLLISALIGYSYAGFSFRPVNQMIERVTAIKGRNLSERVPVPAGKDEITKLAKTLNSMLERVEASFQAQERFVSDASHQMKTPLAILKAQIGEMLKSCEDSSGEKQQQMESLQEEVDSLIALVNNLLILARVDVGEETLHFSQIQLDEVITHVCERLAPLAKRKNIQFHFDLEVDSKRPDEPPFIVRGDDDLLMSVFQSLLENSIKYSPPDTKIDITLSESEGEVMVTVMDQGPGVDPTEVQTIFERFRRGKILVPGVSGS
ncbi:MAG: HAMP domain-containing histidine kinase, partial [Bdellovibrionales bacterium]|nr:HAMP domain-containing histidine kinase [Bdellovibrionales bacterium]